VTVSVEQAKEELLGLMMHGWTAAVSAKDKAYFDRHVDEDWQYIAFTAVW
jgi:hypothetical protein